MYCGTLWVRYMCGHGWSAYYKKAPDVAFKSPSMKLKIDMPKSQFDESMRNRWNELLKKTPQEKEGLIEQIKVPNDIMSVLKYLFKDENEMKKWLFTCRERIVGFKLPIDILKEEGGMDKVRFLLFQTYI